MSSIRWRLPIAALFTILAAACSRAGESADAADNPAGGLPGGHPPTSAQAAAPRAQGPGGVVLEAIDGGGYTYLRLGAQEGSEQKEIWVAGPVTALEVGDTVELVNPMAMGNFTSKALNRSFDQIYFADAFRKPGQTPAPAAGRTGAGSGVVQETMDSGGYTYVRVTADGSDVWLAGPTTELKEGDPVAWSSGIVMRGFVSKTLDRTFDEILFVNALQVGGGG